MDLDDADLLYNIGQVSLLPGFFVSLFFERARLQKLD
jgi:hypothetical protein